MDTLPPELMPAFFEQTLSRGISVIALYVFLADLEWPPTVPPELTYLLSFGRRSLVVSPSLHSAQSCGTYCSTAANQLRPHLQLKQP